MLRKGAALPPASQGSRPHSAEGQTHRLRVRYTKRGRMRFASHRDIARTVERALRRARVPIAYSAGFNPHPKISYPGAAPTGVASEAEYLEIVVTEFCEAEQLRHDLDASMPDGLDVCTVEIAPAGSLTDELQGSVWQIDLPGVSPEAADGAVAAFLDAAEVEVERVTKKGRRRFDTRGAVLALWARRHNGTDPEYATIQLVVQHATPAVRPDDVVTALRQVADLAPPALTRVTRLAQGSLSEISRFVPKDQQPAAVSTQSVPTAERPQ